MPCGVAHFHKQIKPNEKGNVSGWQKMILKELIKKKVHFNLMIAHYLKDVAAHKSKSNTSVRTHLCRSSLSYIVLL